MNPDYKPPQGVPVQGVPVQGVPAQGVPVVYLQHGEQFVNGQVVQVPSGCDKKQMPSVCCPIWAFICCWPLGIASIVFYINAQSAKGRCFTCLICSLYHMSHNV